MCSDKHIRSRIQRILDKIINKFRSSGNKMVSGAANKVKTSQEREAKEEKQKADADAAAKETKDKRLAGKASGNKADSLGLWASNATEWLDARQKTQKASAFHVTGLTSALNGEREGNLGVDLDKSKRLQERIKYYEDKRHAKRETKKKQIAETPENGDNGDSVVLALPSEQVDENHVAAQQAGDSAEQDSRVVAEQTLPSEQVDESHVTAQQSDALEEQDSRVVAEQTETSEQTDESHVAVQQSGASEEQNSHVVAEQTQPRNQPDESNVETQQSNVLNAENNKSRKRSGFDAYLEQEKKLLANQHENADIHDGVVASLEAPSGQQGIEQGATIATEEKSLSRGEELRKKYGHLSDEKRKALLQKKIEENTKRRKNETPIHSGVKRPPNVSIPNSIYEQIDNGGHLQCRAFYDSEGREFARQDFTHPHYEKKASRYLMPHEHRFRYNEKGLRISKETYDVPDGYTGTPTNVQE